MPKFIFLICLLALSLQGQAGLDLSDPIKDIGLNVNLLQNNPGLLAADTIGIIVDAQVESYYKLSFQNEIIASGQFNKGENPLLVTWPGMFAKTQSLSFILDLKTGAQVLQKVVLITITVSGMDEQVVEPSQAPKGEFNINMFYAGQLIGFRKKTMTELMKLTTGLVTPVADPGLSGSAINRAPPSQSISVFGMALGIAKYMAGKKLAAAKKLALANAQKRKMTVSFDSIAGNGEKKTIQAEIELQVQ